jgi:hypothetical protein
MNSYSEIEHMIARGDVKGKLTRDDLPTPALILELDAFEDNVARTAAFAKQPTTARCARTPRRTSDRRSGWRREATVWSSAPLTAIRT